MWSQTYEELEKLKKELKDIQKVLSDYRQKTVQSIWITELDEFITAYNNWLKELEEEQEKEREHNEK